MVTISAAVVSFIVGLLLKDGLPSYAKEKFKNLATKEDIEGITLKVESVRDVFAKSLEEHRSKLWLSQQKAMWLREEYKVKLNAFSSALLLLAKLKKEIGLIHAMSKNRQLAIASCPLGASKQDIDDMYERYLEFRSSARTAIDQYNLTITELSGLRAIISVYFDEGLVDLLDDIERKANHATALHWSVAEFESAVKKQYEITGDLYSARENAGMLYDLHCQRNVLEVDVTFFCASLREEVKKMRDQV